MPVGWPHRPDFPADGRLGLRAATPRHAQPGDRRCCRRAGRGTGRSEPACDSGSEGLAGEMRLPFDAGRRWRAAARAKTCGRPRRGCRPTRVTRGADAPLRLRIAAPYPMKYYGPPARPARGKEAGRDRLWQGRRPRPRHRPGRKNKRGAHTRLRQPRVAGAHRLDAIVLVLEPLARQAVDEGRGVGQHAGRKAHPGRLRLGRRHLPGRAGGAGLPHGRADVLPQRAGRAGRAAAVAPPPVSTRPRSYPRRREPTRPPRRTGAAGMRLPRTRPSMCRPGRLPCTGRAGPTCLA